MKTHELKSWMDFFEPLYTGIKKFEVRVNDRKFSVGDILHLREYNDRAGKYTGRSLRKKITYILEGGGAGFIAPRQGINRHFVVLSLDDVGGEPVAANVPVRSPAAAVS